MSAAAVGREASAGAEVVSFISPGELEFEPVNERKEAGVKKGLLSPTLSSRGGEGEAAAQFHFTLSGPAEANAVIFASTNLQTWTPLATNPLTGGSLSFTDALATNFTRRFYRATLQP